MCPGTAGTFQDRAQHGASRPPRGNRLVPCLSTLPVNSSPDKKCHCGRLVSGRPLGQLAALGPGRTQEAFWDLFVQEAILISVAWAWSRIEADVRNSADGEGSQGARAARAQRSRSRQQRSPADQTPPRCTDSSVSAHLPGCILSPSPLILPPVEADEELIPSSPWQPFTCLIAFIAS